MPICDIWGKYEKAREDMKKRISGIMSIVLAAAMVMTAVPLKVRADVLTETPDEAVLTEAVPGDEAEAVDLIAVAEDEAGNEEMIVSSDEPLVMEGSDSEEVFIADRTPGITADYYVTGGDYTYKGAEMRDSVSPDYKSLFTAIYNDKLVEERGGRYYTGEEVISLKGKSGTGSEVTVKDAAGADIPTKSVNKGKKLAYTVNDLPAEFAEGFTWSYKKTDKGTEYDISVTPDDLKNKKLYAWEYQVRDDGMYERVSVQELEYSDIGSYSAGSPSVQGQVCLDTSKLVSLDNPVAVIAFLYDASTDESLFDRTRWSYYDTTADGLDFFDHAFAALDDAEEKSGRYTEPGSSYYNESDGTGNGYYLDEIFSLDRMGTFSIAPYRFARNDSTGIVTLFGIPETGYGNYNIEYQLTQSMIDVTDGYRFRKDGVVQRDHYYLNDWIIPATWTDPTTGTIYKVKLGANEHEKEPSHGESGIDVLGKSYSYAAHRKYPNMATGVTISKGVLFPEDCTYLLTTSASKLFRVKSLKIEGEPGSVGSNITDMTGMFVGNPVNQGRKLDSLDIAALDTKNVTSMRAMFLGQNILGNLDVTTLNTGKVKDFSYMFYEVRCKNIDPDVSGFNTSSAEDMSSMFAADGSWSETITLGKSGTEALGDFEVLDLGSFDFSTVTRMTNMFANNHKLEKVIFPGKINTSKVTDMSGMFMSCPKLKEVTNLDKFNTANVTDMAQMFGRYYSPRNVETIGDGEEYDHSDRFSFARKASDSAGPAFTTLDLSNFDTSKVTDMSGMFDLPNLTRLTFGTGFDTSKVKYMERMFNLPSLESLDISGFDTGSLVFARHMFELGHAVSVKLDGLNLSGLNSEQASDRLFNFPVLRELDLTKVSFGSNTNALTTFSIAYFDGAEYDNLCGGCMGLTSLKLPAGLPEFANAARLPYEMKDGTITYTQISGGNNAAFNLTAGGAEPEGVMFDGGLPSFELFEHETIKVWAHVYPYNADQSLIWSVKDAGIASVDQTGFVTGLKQGTTELTIKSGKNNDLTQTATIYVYKNESDIPTPAPAPTPMIKGKYLLTVGEGGNCTITLGAESYPYANAAIKPSVTVKASIVNSEGVAEERTLIQGKDFTVSYKNNKAVAGINAVKKSGKDAAPQVIVKGKGKYLIGSAKNPGVIRKFEITKRDIGSLTLTLSDVAYNKAPNRYKKTGIRFFDDTYRDMKLKAGKDYTAVYTTSGGSDIPAAGETVTVTLTAAENSSNYTGSISGTYRITDKTYTAISKAKVIINPNEKGKTESCRYTGSQIRPGEAGQPVLKLTVGSGRNLKELTINPDSEETETGDYSIIGYYNNINPGKNAVILIRGTGKYCGVRAVKFKIVK